ncbi:MAG: GntR family transcriptional regulator [Cytophagales bacterium]|nr:MAG: GntR family transcriptional regulator [Cytophagales bacterium]
MPLDNSSLTDKVTQKLRDAIINLEYLPGEHLTQAIISKKFGVSHIPAREALMKLENEGYVKQLPYRGAIVAPFSSSELDDILQIRIVLEQLVIKEAIINCNQEVINKLEKSIVKITSTKNPIVLTKAHNEFYNTFFHIPSRPYWMELYQHSNHRLFRYFGVYLKTTIPSQMDNVPSYQQILESIKKNNIDKTLELFKERYIAVIDIIKLGIQSF